VTEAVDSAAAPLRAEGVPFVLKAFTVVAHDPERVAQHAPLTALGLNRAALPVEGDVVRVAGAGAVPRVLGHARSRAGIVVQWPKHSVYEDEALLDSCRNQTM
jgi:hypothetical protein